MCKPPVTLQHRLLGPGSRALCVSMLSVWWWVAVPLYDSLGESAVEYTVGHSETSLIFADGPKLAMLSKAAAGISKTVKTIAYWGDAPAGAVPAIEKEARPTCLVDNVLLLAP